MSHWLDVEALFEKESTPSAAPQGTEEQIARNAAALERNRRGELRDDSSRAASQETPETPERVWTRPRNAAEADRQRARAYACKRCGYVDHPEEPSPPLPNSPALRELVEASRRADAIAKRINEAIRALDPRRPEGEYARECDRLTLELKSAEADVLIAARALATLTPEAPHG